MKIRNPSIYALLWIVGINFGLRGREGLRKLTMDNFKIRKDRWKGIFIGVLRKHLKNLQGRTETS